LEPIRKYLLAGGLFVILLAAVGIALILASRWLTGSEAVRKKIAAEATRLTGGQLRYEKLALHLLPLPHLTAEQVDFQLPGKVALNTAALAIYPDFPALLTGSLELVDFVIDRPEIRIDAAHRATKAAPATKVDAHRALKEYLAAFFGALARLGPDLKIRVKNGLVTMLRQDKPELNLEQINLYLRSREQFVDLSLDCFSPLSGQLSFKGKVNLESRSSSGRLEVDGLNARALMAELPPLPGITVSDTRLEIEADFTSEEAEKIEARVAVRLPDVRIQRQQRQLELQDTLLKGDIKADPKTLAWDIKTLKIASKNLELESRGEYSYGSPSGSASLILDAVGRQIDVAAVAGSFTEFVGDQGWVQTAFKIARAGTLTKATCHLEARRAEQGWTVPQLKAGGHLDQGLIFIPGAEMDLEAVSGDVLLVNQRVDFKQMKGRLPYGTFAKVDAHINWQQDAQLGISASRAKVELEKFYPWLAAFKGLQDMRRFITTADGDLDLTRLDITGPLANPAAWKIEVATGVKSVVISSPKLDGPLQLSQGYAGFRPQGLTLDKLQVQYLDANLTTTSEILGKPGQPETMHLSLDGTIGEQALVWTRRFLEMPEHLRVQPPLKLSGVDLQWDNRGNVAVTGELSTAGGARAIAEAAFAPGRWEINRFELEDGISDVSIKLTKADQHIELDYTGKLQKTTLDRILRDNKTLKGWVDGNLKASLDIKNLRASNVTGTLQGEGLILRGLPVSALEFERFSLECRGKNARLEAADLLFAGTPMHLKGTAGITDAAYTFDLELTADSLDAAAFAKIKKGPSGTPENAQAAPRAKPPINGVIRFKTPRFTFKDYTWKPLHADIAIQADVVHITATRADLCGIATPGTIRIDPGGTQLSFRPSADKQNLQATWECLQNKQLRADSLFSLDGTIEAQGPAADLVSNLQGEISFSSDDGMIHRSSILTKIFAFLNITEVFAGKVTGLREKGFGYDTIRAHAAIESGALNFDEILVDGHTMKVSGEGTVDLVRETLDLSLLVAPLKTFDRIVKKMPVLGYITGGSVLSAPVRIKGSTKNPEVVPLPPAAVGRGLMGVLERTLKAPLKVVESLPGLEGRAEPSAESKKNESSAADP